MALVEWRKEGQDVVLPGDDPHISVQVKPLPEGHAHAVCLQPRPLALLSVSAVKGRSFEIRALQLAAD